MAENSLLQRCLEAAAGHEAAHGTGSRCLYHDLADELKRLLAIETDVRRLLAYAGEAKTGTYQGRYWDPIRQESVSLEVIATRRVDAGKRLLAAVKGA